MYSYGIRRLITACFISIDSHIEITGDSIHNRLPHCINMYLIIVVVARKVEGMASMALQECPPIIPYIRRD